MTKNTRVRLRLSEYMTQIVNNKLIMTSCHEKVLNKIKYILENLINDPNEAIRKNG